MKVGGHALFNKAVFAGLVDLIGAGISGDFEAGEAQFENAEKEAIFNSMKVGGTVFFRNAVFSGPVDFRRADIAGNFDIDGARFTNAEKEAIFNSMKVGGTAFFGKVIFEGSVDFGGAEIAGNFDANEAQFNSLEQEAKFNNMKVGDSAIFRNTVFSGPIRLEGMTYQHITAGDEGESLEKLLDLVNKSAYSVDVYSNLEDFFQRRGNPERADEIFVEQKRRERREVLRGPTSGAWWMNWFLDILVRHGRSPGRAFLWSAFFVFIGCFVFRRRQDMEPQNPQDASRSYNALWYSLDLFLPFIDLQAASIWIPKQGHRFRRNHMRVHTILGWVLIPIGLAAFTGIVG